MANPFEMPGEWLKGNLHCHTTNSDGVETPEERVANFHARGYDFLGISDHGLVTSVEENGTDLTLVSCGEFHPSNPYSDHGYHLLALGVPAGSPNLGELEMQPAIDAIRDVGGLPVLAHPYWCGLTREDIQPLKGLVGIEIFNTTCEVSVGKGIANVYWDELLAQREEFWALAVDDCHSSGPDAYQGWIMVKSAERTQQAILAAIAEGAFYASTGPTIKSANYVAGEGFKVECSEVDYIDFIANGPCGHRVRSEDGSPVTSASWEMSDTNPGDFTPYVRIECVSKLGGTAWTNPFYFERSADG